MSKDLEQKGNEVVKSGVKEKKDAKFIVYDYKEKEKKDVKHLYITKVNDKYITIGMIEMIKGDNYDDALSLIGEIIVEGYSEINGLLIPKNYKKDKESGTGTNGNGNDTNVLYFTDKNFSGVLKIKLSAISQELEKLQENKF